MPKKGRLGQFADLKGGGGGPGKKGGGGVFAGWGGGGGVGEGRGGGVGVFAGRLIPNAHYAKGNRNIRYATLEVSNLNRFRMFC